MTDESIDAAGATLTAYFQRSYRGPERLAFRVRTTGGIETLSNRALFERAEQFAVAYLRAGCVPGTIVLIVLPHSGDLLAAFVGAVIGGFVPAVLPPPSNRQDPDVFWAHMAEMLRTAQRAPVVATHTLTATLPPGSPLHERTFVVPDRLPDRAEDVAWHEARADETAFLQFSSGTTGLRKGVVITHRMFGAQVEAYRARLGFADGDRIASWLPLYHDMGLVACFLEPLALGLPANLIDPFLWVNDPAILFADIETFGATHVWMPNFAFHHLANTVEIDRAYELSSVKAFINCSERCTVAAFELFARTFAASGISPEKMLTCYAMAETVFAVTQSAPAAPIRVYEHDGIRIPSVGRLLPGLELRIVDGCGATCAERIVGEIELKGTMVTSGYLNNEEATLAAFDDGWFRTGDLGLQCDGELYITGRKKDLLIVNGRNYYAHDIEAIVSHLPEIRPGRAIAFGFPSERTGTEELIVVAEPRRAGTDPSIVRRAIKSAVGEALNVTVARVVLVPHGWIVKTTSGKIDRESNRRKYAAELT